MDNGIIFIGDVAGEFDALMRLVEKCPKDRKILLLGDLNDRGPDSKSVIDWAMKNPLVDSVFANHEDMFIDWFEGTKIYSNDKWPNLWVDHNGGKETLKSYNKCFFDQYDEQNWWWVPRDHIEWLKTRPLFVEGPDWIATHAAINPAIPWEMALNIRKGKYKSYDDSVIWNRGKPRRRKDGKFQVHGHNSYRAVHWYKDKLGVFGACIDTSWSETLSALVWPEKETITVPLKAA